MDVVGIFLTVVLLLVIPIGFLLGMINPNWVRMVGRPQVFFRFSAMGFGCVVLLIIVALLSPKDSDVPTTSEATDTKQNESYESKDLSWFIEQDAGERRNVVNGLMAAAKLDGKESEAFYTCLSDYASSKSKELSVAQVFGWCEREFNSEPAKFRGHFNELDAKDESVMGYVMCKQLVEAQLLSPSTADFPFTSDGSWSMGRQRYVYKLHVDSQNAYGAMVRTNWHCDVQYKGPGESADINNWTLHKLEQQ